MPNHVKSNTNYPDISISNALYNRADKLIPSGTQTLAKGPQQFIDGVAPKYLARGKGSHVWDVDGNEYIDYNMGIGPISLGYAYDKVDQAIKEQLESGITFSLMHPLEVEVAELLHQIIPNAEAVRYSKTGADVTSAAIRIARAFTRREKVLSCGYHGWHDWYITVTDRRKGIPEFNNELSFTFNYNDLESLKSSLDEDIACVIMEPTVFAAPNEGFLHEVKELCWKNGSLLIFDEMWTGFRLAPGGAQEYFAVKPDLATYSKAIANGMPISVLTGRKDVMSLFGKDVFFYTTFGGEALSLAAAKATIEEIHDKNVTHYLDKQGARLKEGYNQLAKDLKMNYTQCIGYNCRSLVTFDPAAGDSLLIKSLVQQEMIKRGILWAGFHTISFSHSDDDINYTLQAYEEVLPILKEAVENDNVQEWLRGKPVQPVFRKTSNFNIKPRMKYA